MRDHCTFITTRKGGEFYIGKGKTAKVEAGTYRGSGVKLKRKMKGTPASEWLTVILGLYNTAEEAYAAERELVTEKVLRDPDCLNLRVGGLGGSNGPDTAETKLKKSISGKIAAWTPAAIAKRASRPKWTEETRAKHRASQLRVQKEVQNRPEVNAKRSVSLVEANKSDDLRARRSASLRKSNQDPAVQKRRSEAAKLRWAKQRAVLCS